MFAKLAFIFIHIYYKLFFSEGQVKAMQSELVYNIIYKFFKFYKNLSKFFLIKINRSVLKLKLKVTIFNSFSSKVTTLLRLYKMFSKAARNGEEMECFPSSTASFWLTLLPLHVNFCSKDTITSVSTLSSFPVLFSFFGEVILQ